MGSELTNKQKRFCEEYVIDWNATRAAKAAGYSVNTAEVIGHENLRKPNIAEYIEEIQKDIAKLAGISALKVLNELSGIAFSKDKKTRHSDKIKANEVINKMLGYNAPEKREVKNKHEFDDWTNEQLEDEFSRLSEENHNIT